MQIKMLVGMGGTEISLRPGDPHECDEAEAIRLIEAGAAEPIGGGTVSPQREKATRKGAAETR